MEELDQSALVERYQNLTDEELLRLVDRRAELVSMAQLALDQEAGRRRARLELLRRTQAVASAEADLRATLRVSRSIRCTKCAAEMKEGFVLDSTYGGRLVSRWVSGKPEESFWTGLKVEGREQLVVQTFRCVACGYLESYANEACARDA